MEIATCFVCGVWIDHGHGRAEPGWARHYRAVYIEDETNDVWDPTTLARLSGVAVTRQRVKRVPVDSTEGARTAQISLNHDGLALPGPEGTAVGWTMAAARGFGLHERCWGIVVAVRPHEELDLQCLLHVLLSFPAPQRIVDFGHEYGDIMTRASGLFGCEGALYPRRGLYTRGQFDHIDAPALQSFFTDTGSFHAEGEGIVAPERAVPARGDPFATLPEETLALVFEELPSADVVRLRRASRACANGLLRDSFWKSRFISGREFDFIFEAWDHAVSLAGRWKSLYLLARATRETPEVTNRRRVWDLARSLWGLVHEAGNVRLRGGMTEDGGRERGPWVTASWALCHLRERFDRGARAIWTRRVSVPREALIYISRVDIHGASYISGIRFESDGKESDMGYIRNETLAFDGRMDLSGFHLAQSQRGIRGLAVLGSAGQMSDWIGDHAGIARRRLVLGPERGPVRYIKAGFDALKLVSLSLSDGSGRQETGASTPPLRDSVLWYPDIPDPRFSITGIDPIRPHDNESEAPAVLAVYGGACGERLGKISSVSVRYPVERGYKGSITRVDISFADGAESVGLGLEEDIRRRVTCMPYGGGPSAGVLNRSGVVDMQDDVELKFEIDGEGGERITGLSVSSAFALKIHTSRGREARFPPGGVAEDDEHHGPLVRVPTMGRTVVGFCSRVCPRDGLKGMGLVCIGEERL